MALRLENPPHLEDTSNDESDDYLGAAHLYRLSLKRPVIGEQKLVNSTHQTVKSDSLPMSWDDMAVAAT